MYLLFSFIRSSLIFFFYHPIGILYRLSVILIIVPPFFGVLPVFVEARAFNGQDGDQFVE